MRTWWRACAGSRAGMSLATISVTVTVCKLRQAETQNGLVHQLDTGFTTLTS